MLLLVIGEVNGGSSGTFDDYGFIVGKLEEMTRGLENPNIPTFRVHISSKVVSFSGIYLNLKLFEARSSRDEACIKISLEGSSTSHLWSLKYVGSQMNEEIFHLCYQFSLNM